MSATRYMNSQKVVLYCRQPCLNSVTIEGTTSTLTARLRAAADHGWACPTHARRTATDLCPDCQPPEGGEAA